ncbi:hypothetical protein Pint_10245 [Pistacia integerrima]|uniref:Uncharacterized protein n=1 Tax=Pistacia integerrima TaxID=434235 RepID=A0ACC0XKL3_9ROSI|nr:hypothetical protein Pint_10245 [Pistacia integerrima]
MFTVVWCPIYSFRILSANRFSGDFPRSLGNLKNLTDLISDHNFTGTVPEFIGGWTSLQRLEMHSSGLEGPIPHSIFGLGNLSDLRISDINGPKFKFPNLSNKNIKYGFEILEYVWIYPYRNLGNQQPAGSGVGEAMQFMGHKMYVFAFLIGPLICNRNET